MFAGWLQPGEADGSRPVKIKREASSPVVSVEMGSDVFLQAVYVPREPPKIEFPTGPRLPREFQSTNERFNLRLLP